MKYKVCVITTTRADYGLLSPVMDLIHKDKDLALQVIAAGSHLSKDLGLTYRAIEKDGFPIHKKVDHLSEDDSTAGIARAAGNAVNGFTQALLDLEPDAVLILGDRYEIMSAAFATLLANIPLIHLHGGEITQGAYDNSIRHAVTKIASLHFASTREYRHRIIQMGEDPNTVYHVGAIGVENIRRLELMSKEELEQDLGISFDRDIILFTYHPETLSSMSLEEQCLNVLSVLEQWDQGYIIFTKANADTGGRAVNQILEDFVSRYPRRSFLHASLGQKRYLSVMRHAALVMGNSSSGIIETPSFGVPTLNIGDRQKGRVRADSVIDCPHDEKSIQKAFQQALSRDFRDKAGKTSNPYDKADTAKNILRYMKLHLEKGMSVEKHFYDIDFTVH